MRFLSFQLQPIQYGPHAMVSYTTDEIEESKLKTYSEFRQFLFSVCNNIQEKAELINELDKYEFVVLNIRKGTWRVIPPDMTAPTLFQYMQEEIKAEKESNNKLGNMLTNLIESVTEFTKSDNNQKLKDKLRNSGM